MYIFQVTLNVIMKLVFCIVSCVSFCAVFFVDSDFSRLPPDLLWICGFTWGPGRLQSTFRSSMRSFRAGVNGMDCLSWTWTPSNSNWCLGDVSRCQQVDFVGFLLFKVMFLTVMERCEFEIFCFFSRGKCTQKYPLKGKLMSKKQILNWLEFEKIRTKIPNKA